MPKYKIKDLAEEISIRVDNPKTSGYEFFVGLEHYDSGKPIITRYGSTSKLDSSAKVFKSGDILIARRNVYLKRAGVVYFDGLTSGDSIVIRARTESVQKILPFVFNTTQFWDYASKHADGSMSKRLSPKNLLEFEVNLPSNDVELTKLSNLLWSIYDSMHSYEDVIAKSDELIKSQFIEMFGKIKEKRTLADLCCKITDGSHAPSKGIDKSNYLMLSSQNIFDELVLDDVRYLTKEDFIKENRRTNIEEGDLLLTIVGTIGRTHVVKKNEKYVFQRSVCVIKPKTDVLNSVFLESYLKTDEGFNQLDNGGHGTTQKGIYLKNVNNLLIPLANMNDQLLFVSFKTQIDKSKFEIEKSLNNLKKIYEKVLRDNF